MNLNTGMAGSAAAGVLNGPGGLPGQFASPVGQDRLVRKEVSLGLIREIVPPQNHIGLQLFPLLEVPTDDVIFNYALGDADGLAPARAEDAESELARKDDAFVTEGRASVIDWSIKDHYTASDVSRYREWLTILEAMRDNENLTLTATSATEGWQQRMARDTLKRRRKLDNRLEWLIMSALSTGVISYNDGKIKFTTDYGRPSGQQLVLGTNTNVAGNASYPLGAVWSGTTSDPILDITSIQQYAYDVYGVRITRAVTSRRVLNSILNSSKFIARTGLVVGGTPVSSSIDPRYLIDGWGPTAAQQIVESQTGLAFMEYDSVYRTRALGSSTFVSNRFLPDNRIIFLPDEADVAEFDDTDLGFGRVLTSPHPAGNWSPGFYEWEKEYGVDPWGYDVGTGIKAFPVFPHMDLSFALDVL
jgi:hypothetical protein